MKNKAYASPDKDAGWGLIYRLNNLWGQVDPKATSGNLDSWNWVLDRIYCNLLYGEDLVIKKIYECKEGHKISTYQKLKECPTCLKSQIVKSKLKLIRIESIELSDEDEMVYKFLTRKITQAKNNTLKMSKVQKGQPKKDENKKNIEDYKEEHYLAVMMKDIWLRKFMQDLGLYLKVSHSDPSHALFGGGA